MITEVAKDPFSHKKLPPPGVIWHYTSVDVLEPFLRGEIAFAHYRFMNDDLELSYGRQLLRDIFDRLKDDGLKKFVESEIVDELVADLYLFCLSRDGDNLYQWRSYTPHGGIAVGFDRQKIYSAMHSVLSGEAWSAIAGKINGMLLTCRYNDDFARHVVARLNQTMKSHLGFCCDGCKDFGVFVEKVMKVLLSQKNSSFREEQEERFLLMGFPREKAEIIKGKPRILVKDSSIPNAISCVRMSPHGDNERDRLLVEILRDKYGLKFPIEQSKSSFNGR